ncbi:MAG: PBP1A family penicillin-binding protein [Anaerolineae bacterium]|nr:PBP1A family penicillin-binding protein [Anaerolineae bacterium]
MANYVISRFHAFLRRLRPLGFALCLAVMLVGSAGARAPSPPPRSGAAGALERLTEVSGVPPFQTTRIYDRHGNLLYEIADRGRRTIVPLDVIPKTFIQATIATEDKNFYFHEGVDISAITRAAFQNLREGQIVSGGSTIPQQLARILLLDRKERYSQSLLRKIHEARLAMQLSQRYTKDEILEMYLNSVYYGNQAYGAAAAAEVYFNKPVSELTLAESALLAGLPQAPNYLDPFTNPAAARERQRVVLNLMRRQGYIDDEQMQAALAEELHFASPQNSNPLRAPHFVDYVRDLLLERYGPEGMRQGLQVYTSLDLRYQELAETIARAQIAAIGSRYNASNAAVVILQPATGEILAMVGSLDYFNKDIDGQVNIALSKRQPGSSIKPILYTAAFENGWTPASVIWDTPVRYPLDSGRWYVPHNITGRYYGPLHLRTALSNSLNVPAVKLLHQLGVGRMLDVARRMGITSWRGSESDYGLSLAVGGYEVTLLELTHAYATLANQGKYVPLTPITEIRNGAGEVIFRAWRPDPPVQAVSPIAAYQTTSVLSDARSRQRLFGRNSSLDTSQPTAVKTGTTDGWRDALTVGYTSYMVVGVWVGNSDGTPMRDVIGFRVAGPIWHDIMEAVWADPALHDSLGYAGKPLPKGFTPPPDIYKAPVCDIWPGQFNRYCPVAYEEVFAPPSEENGDIPSDKVLGFCLPTTKADLPQSVLRAAAFIPLPRDPGDAAAARHWGLRYGLRLQRASDCKPVLIRRALAKQPAPPKPRRLVKIPEHMDKVASSATKATATKSDAASQSALQVGDHATLVRGVSSLNVRIGPGVSYRASGYLLHNQTVKIIAGPRRVGSSLWFQIQIGETNLTGWVNGHYLTRVASSPKVAKASSPAQETAKKSGQASSSGQKVKNKGASSTATEEGPLYPGGTAVLVSGLHSLNVRAGPGIYNWKRGYLLAGQTVVVLAGPRQVGRSPWFQVRVVETGLTGWVNGRYLRLSAHQQQPVEQAIAPRQESVQ